LYIFVSCNKYQIRDKLIDHSSVSPYQLIDIKHHIPEVSSIIVTDSINKLTVNDSTINNSDMPINNADDVNVYYYGKV